jgi:hypothetical protein
MLGMCVAFFSMAIVLVLTFEFSRVFAAYDYRNFSSGYSDEVAEQLLVPGQEKHRF